jgi:hypothetical protein
MNELTDEARQKIEAGFALKREACQLLGVIAAEFKSDPMSVQCFDLRIVQRAIEVSAALDDLERRGYLL